MVMILRKSLDTQGADAVACQPFSPELVRTGPGSGFLGPRAGRAGSGGDRQHPPWEGGPRG